MKSNDPPPRGLPAVHEGRQRRGRFPAIPPRFWLWTGMILAVWAIIYWKYTQGQLESWRNRLMARQRAVSLALGPRYTPLATKIESWTQEASGAFPGNHVEPGIPQSQILQKSGVYLRLFIDDAREVQKLRDAAMSSFKDAFTTCLIDRENPRPWDGPPCRWNHDCKSGEHCNAAFYCTVPAQPYDLRIAYRATRILRQEWVDDVRDAGSDMRLRLLERDFDSVVADDVPMAIDLMTQAKYFLLVLDEQSEQPTEVPDGGVLSQVLQGVKHPVRVFLWHIESGKQLLRFRGSVSPDVQIVQWGAPGSVPPVSDIVKQHVQQQARNCALAREVRALIEEQTPEVAPAGSN